MFSESSYEISWFWWFYKIMSTCEGIFCLQIDSEDQKFLLGCGALDHRDPFSYYFYFTTKKFLSKSLSRLWTINPESWVTRKYFRGNWVSFGPIKAVKTFYSAIGALLVYFPEFTSFGHDFRMKNPCLGFEPLTRRAEWPENIFVETECSLDLLKRSKSIVSPSEHFWSLFRGSTHLAMIFSGLLDSLSSRSFDQFKGVGGAFTLSQCFKDIQ